MELFEIQDKLTMEQLRIIMLEVFDSDVSDAGWQEVCYFNG